MPGAYSCRGTVCRVDADPEITRYLEVALQKNDVTTLVGFIKNNNTSDDNLLLGLFPKSEPRRHIGNITLGPSIGSMRPRRLGSLSGRRIFGAGGLLPRQLQRCPIMLHDFGVA